MATSTRHRSLPSSADTRRARARRVSSPPYIITPARLRRSSASTTGSVGPRPCHAQYHGRAIRAEAPLVMVRLGDGSEVEVDAEQNERPQQDGQER